MDIHMHVLVKPAVQSKPVAFVYIVYFKVQVLQVTRAASKSSTVLWKSVYIFIQF